MSVVGREKARFKQLCARSKVQGFVGCTDQCLAKVVLLNEVGNVQSRCSSRVLVCSVILGQSGEGHRPRCLVNTGRLLPLIEN